MLKKIWFTLCVVALVASLPNWASAASLTYAITVGNNNGFEHSYIHAATHGRASVGHNTVYMSGRRLFEVSGSITGELTDTGSGWSFQASGTDTLTATVLGHEWWMGRPSVGDAWNLAITGGELLDVDRLSDGGASGWLSYTLSNPTASISHSGTWHFLDSNRIPGPPNDFSDSSINLWGNNWEGKHRPHDWWRIKGYRALGLDLGGSVLPEPGPLPQVPVPGNFASCLMLALFAPVGIFLVRRRQRNAS